MSGIKDSNSSEKSDENGKEPTAHLDPDSSTEVKAKTSTDTAEEIAAGHMIDISDELQDELCQLWDMSSDEDVAKLLDEFKAIDILTEVISKSNAPRATVRPSSHASPHVFC